MTDRSDRLRLYNGTRSFRRGEAAEGYRSVVMSGDREPMPAHLSFIHTSSGSQSFSYRARGADKMVPTDHLSGRGDRPLLCHPCPIAC
jgi:hypothetical protein